MAQKMVLNIVNSGLLLIAALRRRGAATAACCLRSVQIRGAVNVGVWNCSAALRRRLSVVAAPQGGHAMENPSGIGSRTAPRHPGSTARAVGRVADVVGRPFSSAAKGITDYPGPACRGGPAHWRLEFHA
jgi:hypothetical protein